jgi:hypothetical protein
MRQGAWTGETMGDVVVRPTRNLLRAETAQISDKMVRDELGCMQQMTRCWWRAARQPGVEVRREAAMPHQWAMSGECQGKGVS